MTPDDYRTLALFSSLLAAIILLAIALIVIFGKYDDPSFPRARGDHLDRIGHQWNLQRKRWWIFKESDASYSRRLDANVRLKPKSVTDRVARFGKDKR